jgi:hypothetical protein
MTTERLVAALVASFLLFGYIRIAGAREMNDQPTASPAVVNLVNRAVKKGFSIKLFLRDKRIISGRVMEVRAHEFDFTADETGMRETFRFVDVKNAKGPPTRRLIKVIVAAGAIVGGLLIFHYGLQPKT